MDPDVALASRLASDLDRAFSTLVTEHANRLYTIALRILGTTMDAEEVAQDALVRAHAALRTYEPERIRALRLRPWLAAITINLARNRRRRVADRYPAAPLEPLRATGFEPSAPDAAGPGSTAERRDVRLMLIEALRSLPPAQCEAVVLRHVDGLSVAEIAAALERPEGTVKAHIHRGLRQLRLQLTNDMEASGRAREMTA